MSEIRRITITGGSSVLSGTSGDQTATRATRRQRVKVAQPVMKVVVEEKIPASAVATVAQTGGSEPAAPVTTTKTIQVIQTVEPAIPAPSTSKVILGGKKPRQMKVLLTKKNHDAAAVLGATTPLNDTPVAQQQKNRKVTLGLQHLKRRVTKARRLQKISKTASIDQIRKELIAAKIIKEDSKAPESILRQMYSDAKLVSTKSL
jgi:hypothetical protein